LPRAPDPVGDLRAAAARVPDGRVRADPAQQALVQRREDGRIVEVDGYGNKRHDKPQYVIRKDRVYETSYGRIQHHKPSWIVGKDGRVVQTDGYGNKRYDKPQYQVKDGKVYETDAYGNVRQQKFQIKKN
jgi:hypothetical protein